MEAFSRVTAVALPLLFDNIDTDIIIPSREMKSVGKTGLADGLFAGWRYTAVGNREPAPDFLMNQPPFDRARVLIAGVNVGCGSSREHAVWALHEYGFRAVIAPSFNPIFRGNCIRNGVVPVQLEADSVRLLGEAARADPLGQQVTVDLDAMTASSGAGSFGFALEEDSRAMLRNGWDAIDLTLQHRDRIAAWREADRAERPWIYLEPRA
ncbi:3-isopropylmalate dehydratase small subunit [Sphingomonas sp. HF-S4]|uniref:3-isopropylmalate dehydratase small subunit n=1 Tax=Sphingomonas agrestis TaxID=3080540 RepID=A0ABU3Y3Z0_9SPHN|nr:3-isopropylmalate dehydratase small subunit [Sphingomonas sp. HF-S4]MDV3456084.1 3-isopropylmalate dehydratase small subunit [Sphingomonas sp. HF-S4]